MTELPAGWAKARIGDVIVPITSIDPTRSPNKQFQYVDIGSIDNQTHTIGEPKQFSGKAAPSRARRVIRTGDTLFSTVRTYLKNIAQVTDDLDGQLTSTGIAVLRPDESIDSRYLYTWVCSDAFVSNVSLSQDGTMYPAVSDGDVANAAILLPPRPEQRRIVAKIDSLSAKYRRAREHLDHIPRLVEKYKQAILAAAFRGELTKIWRTAHLDLATVTPRSGGEIKRKFSGNDDFAAPFEVPSSWQWLRLPEIGELDRGKSRHRPRDDDRLFGGPCGRHARTRSGRRP